MAGKLFTVDYLLLQNDDNHLFISPSTGKPVSKVLIASWIRRIIEEAYKHFGQSSPEVIRAHSTRAMATSMANLRGASIEDICKAATWSSSYVFSKHYNLDVLGQHHSISNKVLSVVTN